MKIDERSRGRWARVEFRVSAPWETTLLYLTLHEREGAPLDGHFYLRSRFSGRARSGVHRVVFFIPSLAAELRVFALGPKVDALCNGRLTFRPLARIQASAHLLLASSGQTLRRMVQSASFRRGVAPSRLRQLLATLAHEARTPRQDYATWLALFDHWSPDDFAAQTGKPSIAYLVLSQKQTSEALAATLQSLEAQWNNPAYTVFEATAHLTVHQVAGGLSADYIGILQAGEVLPPHATRLAADQLDELGRPEVAIVDDDEVSSLDVRCAPSFKPEPNHTMMLSGGLSRGLWLVQRSTLVRHAPAFAQWAEVLRLAIWFARQRTDARSFGKRIPFILTHRRFDTEHAPPAALAAVVQQHLQDGVPAIDPIPTWPLTFRLRSRVPERRVTAIIPSTLRQPHSLACIRSILTGTDYPLFDVHVAVMQQGQLDTQQRANFEVLQRYPNVTVTLLEARRFNFSEANNRIAARTSSEYILLLNDDVAPIRRDWLCWLAAFLHDPHVGIVGARLLYLDERVQHGGVIMGLSGLCDHAHRYLPAVEPGYMSRAVTAQEMSAVTAACMLVRRDLYAQAGGLDERYPSAFNDVDFSLRIGQMGYSIVYAPQAELHHYELQTYGSHYAGERQPFELEEVRRMRKDWAKVCAVDPFHNPNLSLAPGSEWMLAFPPRVDTSPRHTSLRAPNENGW